MTATGRQGDDAAVKAVGTVDLGADGQGKFAPIEPEGGYLIGVGEVAARGFTFIDLKARVWAAIAVSAGRRSMDDAP